MLEVERLKDLKEVKLRREVVIGKGEEKGEEVGEERGWSGEELMGKIKSGGLGERASGKEVEEKEP